MISADHLLTMDIEFDSLDHLNLALLRIREVLDNLASKNKVSHYYIMRYSPSPNFLGIKIILVDLESKDEVASLLDESSKSILGFIGIRKKEQGNNQNQIGNDSFLASIGMKTRNEIHDLLQRKPSEEELHTFFHYLCNPLGMSYKEEAEFCSYLISRYSKEGVIK